MRLETDAVGVVLIEDFSFATRCAVAGSSADTWIGGKATGDLGFLGSVDDKVCNCVGFNKFCLVTAHLSSLAVNNNRDATFTAILEVFLRFFQLVFALFCVLRSLSLLSFFV